jgi:hypothetical protein
MASSGLYIGVFKALTETRSAECRNDRRTAKRKGPSYPESLDGELPQIVINDSLDSRIQAAS